MTVYYQIVTLTRCKMQLRPGINSIGPVLFFCLFVFLLLNRHTLTIFTCRVSEAGVLVKTYIERSTLVPDHVMSRLMLPRLEQLSGHSWLLDGKKNSAFIFILYWYISFEFFISQQPPSFVFICSERICS